MASVSILCSVAVLIFTSISGDEIDPANLGQAISQVSGGSGGWLRPGQPILIWPLDESALPALLDEREYHMFCGQRSTFLITSIKYHQTQSRRYSHRRHQDPRIPKYQLDLSRKTIP